MDFEYAAPASLDEALQLRAGFGNRAVMLAGGTDILVQLREGLREADFVIDVKRIEELTSIRRDEATGAVRIGASVSCTRISEIADLESAYGAIFDAAGLIGGWQIQNRASLGGNLCNASPAADSIPGLMVHEAVCHVASTDGRREIPVAQFCTGPGTNCLSDDELLVSLQLAAPEPHGSSAYLRFIPRNEMDIAVAGAAVWVRLADDGRTIDDARIALGAVHRTPVLATAASDFLRGQSVSEAVLERVAELSCEGIEPISDMRGTREYRLHLAGILTKRALQIALDRATLR